MGVLEGFFQFVVFHIIILLPIKNVIILLFMLLLLLYVLQCVGVGFCFDTNPFKWGLTLFRFENMWLLHPNFKESFRLWWQEC